jgi:oligopeptide/dipeptide ABC transporter ATP-binding protein
MPSNPEADVTEPLLAVRGLSVRFRTGAATVQAVRDASLELGAGEILGVVGESGCGKSTLARAVLRLIEPPGEITGGEIRFRGRDLLALPESELRKVRGAQIAMVFQDPAKSLNPVYTIGQQITGAMQAHQRIRKAQARERVVGLLSSLGIADAQRRVDQYPHELSGGMRQRAMIAMALCNDPALIIADEATTALDVTVQAQILDLLRTINRERGTSITVISHNLGVIAEICHRVAVLYAGRVVEAGPVDAVFRDPRHPYTRGLIASLPVPGAERESLKPIQGAPPAMTELGRGCAFAPRCPLSHDKCAVDPPLGPVADAGHAVACWAAGAALSPAGVGSEGSSRD